MILVTEIGVDGQGESRVGNSALSLRSFTKTLFVEPWELLIVLS